MTEPRRVRTCPPHDVVRRTDAGLVVRRTVLFEDEHGQPLDVWTTESRIEAPVWPTGDEEDEQ